MKPRRPPEARGLGEHHVELLRRLAASPVPLRTSYATIGNHTVCGQHVGALVRRGLAERVRGTGPLRTGDCGPSAIITPLGRRVLGELEWFEECRRAELEDQQANV